MKKIFYLLILGSFVSVAAKAQSKVIRHPDNSNAVSRKPLRKDPLLEKSAAQARIKVREMKSLKASRKETK